MGKVMNWFMEFFKKKEKDMIEKDLSKYTLDKSLKEYYVYELSNQVLSQISKYFYTYPEDTMISSIIRTCINDLNDGKEIKKIHHSADFARDLAASILKTSQYYGYKVRYCLFSENSIYVHTNDANNNVSVRIKMSFYRKDTHGNDFEKFVRDAFDRYETNSLYMATLRDDDPGEEYIVLTKLVKTENNEVHAIVYCNNEVN